MSLDRKTYKSQILFLKDSMYDNLRNDVKPEVVVTIDPAEQKYVLDQIKLLQKEISYIQNTFVNGEMDTARVNMLLATLSKANNLYGNVMESTTNAILQNINS